MLDGVCPCPISLLRLSLLRLLDSNFPGNLCTPNLPTNIISTKIAWLELSGKFPMEPRILPLNIKIMLESIHNVGTEICRSRCWKASTYVLSPTLGIGTPRCTMTQLKLSCCFFQRCIKSPQHFASSLVFPRSLVVQFNFNMSTRDNYVIS